MWCADFSNYPFDFVKSMNILYGVPPLQLSQLAKKGQFPNDARPILAMGHKKVYQPSTPPHPTHFVPSPKRDFFHFKAYKEISKAL